MTSQFSEDYYLRGVEKGLSNYTDYKWMPERTLPFAKRLIEVLGIGGTDTVLDWGCALGFTVKALHQLGIDAWGYDTSEWAINNCDSQVKFRVHTTIKHDGYDHVLLKDLCEHLQPIDLMKTSDWLLASTRKSILVMVPLSEQVGGQYVRKEDDMDVTHVLRWPLEEWMNFFHRRIGDRDWQLQGSWHIAGLKPTSLSHKKSCGFITIRKIT